MRHKIILNPASGNGRTGKTWHDTERLLTQHLGAFDAANDVVFTRAVKDATLLTLDALRDGYDHVIAIGGDGTFSEVVNGFFVNDRPVNPDAAVSFIPSGTGSDIARTLGIPTDREQAVKHITSRLAQAPRLLDLGKLSFFRLDDTPFTMYFANIASCGMSGIVVRHINRASFLKKFGGKVAFFLASASALVAYRNKSVRISVDGVFIRELPIRAIAVANGQYFGAGMHVAPDAQPDDGLFDIVVMGNISRLQAAWKLSHLYTGTHLHDADVFSMQGKHVFIEPIGNEPVLLDVDGEGPGRLPATLRVLPNMLRMW